MDDPNSIAWLSPAESEDEDRNGRSWQAIRMNMAGYLPSQDKAESDLRSRESTVLSEDEDDQVTTSSPFPRLHLGFDARRKSGHGIMIGTDRNSCDIVLPKLRKISQRHCYITFDAKRRLILRDRSRHGTIVKYDDKGGELRRTVVRKNEGRELHEYFTWILGGNGFPRGIKKIVIEIQGIRLQIVVSRHNNQDQYNSNVDLFLRQSDEPDLDGLGIYTPTAPPTQPYTPNHSSIRVKREVLGTGAFAVVRRYWDVSSGIDYACKEPVNRKIFDSKIWKTEVGIMLQITHVGNRPLQCIIFILIQSGPCHQA